MVQFTVGLFPQGQSLPTAFASGITTVAGYVNAYSFLFNFAALLQVALLTIGFEVALVTVRMFIWLIHLIRGK